MTPLSMRIARLLLVGGAAASAGALVVILSRARIVSPLALAFLVPAVLFAAAATRLHADAPRARAFALAAALALAGLGTLAGFGAGDVTFPAASLGVLAAWSAFLHPPRRVMLVAFALYLAVGVAHLALRPVGLLPFAIGSVLLWPVTLAFFAAGASPLPIFAALGAAVAILARALVPRARARGSTALTRAAAAALVGGVTAVAALVAYANARTETSLRFELDPLAVAVFFASAATLTFGFAVLRALPALGVVAVVVGATLVAPVLIARPSVECRPNGVATGNGPWWWRTTRGASGSAGGSAGGGSSGRIERGDGTSVTYRCTAAGLVEFREERR